MKYDQAYICLIHFYKRVSIAKYDILRDPDFFRLMRRFIEGKGALAK